MNLTVVTDRDAYAPGDELQVIAAWDGADEVPEVVLRLVWQTAGKGTEDSEVVWEKRCAGGGAVGEVREAVRLPVGPYSCSGSLITIQWLVEAQIGRDHADQRFTLAPGGVEVSLQSVPDERLKKNRGCIQANR